LADAYRTARSNSRHGRGRQYRDSDGRDRRRAPSTNRSDPAKNIDTGFLARDGHFHKVVFRLSMEATAPLPSAPKPQTNQLLAINNHRVAVGFYEDAAGHGHTNGFLAKFR